MPFVIVSHQLPGRCLALLCSTVAVVGGSNDRTGRTAGIKARKLEQQGVAGTAESARNILVGGGVGGKRAGFQSDLTFLKNAMGDGVHFCIEKGGSARANLLSQRHPNPQRKKRKLLDAAATRIGTTVTLLDKSENDEREKRKQQQDDEKNQQEQQQEKGGDNNNSSDDDKNDENGNNDSNGRKNGLPGTTGMDWLNNNISREGLDREMERLRKQDREQEELFLAAMAEENDAFHNSHTKIIVLSDYIDPALQNPSLWDENTRKVAFQSLYKKEIGRQTNLLHLPEHNETAGNFSSPPKGPFMHGNSSAANDQVVVWEDG
mmetsp:Transcript_98850/g.200591  ORF Transcript_98850/g.200591 Transcript_98850/m.200591 type:complete len:320 (+) Transcript_98850:82-1041(+)